jgi:hypothetical protein
MERSVSAPAGNGSADRAWGEPSRADLGPSRPTGKLCPPPAACAALVGLAALLALCRAAGSSRPASRTGPSLGARGCVRTVPVHVCAGRPAVGHHGCGPQVDTAQPACLRSGMAQRRRAVGLAQLVAKCHRWSRGHSESSLFPGWPGQSAACHRAGHRPPHTASWRWIPFAATHKSLERIRQICAMDAQTAVAQARILLGRLAQRRIGKPDQPEQGCSVAESFYGSASLSLTSSKEISCSAGGSSARRRPLSRCQPLSPRCQPGGLGRSVPDREAPSMPCRAERRSWI